MRVTIWILAVGMFVVASPMFAGAANYTLAVGSCELQYTSFSTIQAAVNAAPPAGATTILVCPGIYPEQVRIAKKITLKGVASGNANAAIIEPPSSGLVANATSTFDGSLIEAMVLVQNTTATIEDLTLDATNNLTVCGQDPIGIFYQNANGTSTRDNVLHVQVVNGFGCQGGLGIYVESGATIAPPNPSPAANSTVTISYNNVQDYDKNGITADGDGTNVKVNVTYNTVIGAGATSENAQNGIQLYGATGSITYNTVDGDWYTGPDYAATGILVISSASPTISNNTISNTNVGIYLDSVIPGDTDGATVKNNVVTATHVWDAITLCANSSTATGNKINVADEAGFGVYECGDAAPSNTITGNTISGACTGILTGPPVTGTTSPNTYYNVGNQVADSCTNPLVKKQDGAKSHPAASPARGPSKQ